MSTIFWYYSIVIALHLSSTIIPIQPYRRICIFLFAITLNGAIQIPSLSCKLFFYVYTNILMCNYSVLMFNILLSFSSYSSSVIIVSQKRVKDEIRGNFIHFRNTQQVKIYTAAATYLEKSFLENWFSSLTVKFLPDGKLRNSFSQKSWMKWFSQKKLFPDHQHISDQSCILLTTRPRSIGGHYFHTCKSGKMMLEELGGSLN